MNKSAVRKWAPTLLLWCSFGAGHSQNAPPVGTDVLTLESAIEFALSENPELRAANGRTAAAAARAYQARLWSNPELELGVEEWQTRGGGFADAKQTIGVAQTLPFPGKKSLDRRIGHAGVRLQAAELSVRRLELVRDVKAAFFSVLAAEGLAEAAGELVKIAESSAEAARKRVEAGATSDQEPLRAEIQQEQARTELAGFQRESRIARHRLVTLLGRPDLLDANISGVLADSPNATLLQQRPEQWLAAHPSALAARTARDRAELDLRRARLEPYPDVKAGVAGGRLGETDEPIAELRFSLPLPLIDRGKGHQQEARANVAVAEAEVTRVEQELLREWHVARHRLQAAVEQVANYRERILPKASRALQLVRGGFEQGKFDFIDLLDTQRTTAEARLAYQQKLLELNVAQVELEALMPSLSLTSTQDEEVPQGPQP